MLELAKELECEKQIVLGYRDELFLTEEFEKSREKSISQPKMEVWEQKEPF